MGRIPHLLPPALYTTQRTERELWARVPSPLSSLHLMAETMPSGSITWQPGRPEPLPSYRHTVCLLWKLRPTHEICITINMPGTLLTSPYRHHNTEKICYCSQHRLSCETGWPQTCHVAGHDPETSDPPPPTHWD